MKKNFGKPISWCGQIADSMGDAIISSRLFMDRLGSELDDSQSSSIVVINKEYPSFVLRSMIPPSVLA
jgi:hypothetical protein